MHTGTGAHGRIIIIMMIIIMIIIIITIIMIIMIIIIIIVIIMPCTGASWSKACVGHAAPVLACFHQECNMDATWMQHGCKHGCNVWPMRLGGTVPQPRIDEVRRHAC